MQTKKIKLFLIEVYELQDYFYNENGYRVMYDTYLGHETKYNCKHYSLNASCYKRTYKKYVTSESKLNKELGVKDFRKYYLNKDLNKTIKGVNDISTIRNLMTILIVKDLSV